MVVEDRPAIKPDHIAQVQTRIDPNTATWSELAQLPEIGESLAREIVAYREEHRVRASATATSPVFIFRSTKDLDLIPGVGEKTLKRIEPYLRFPE